MADYVGDWLERRDGLVSDLDLIVLLLNSLDLLADPADRLTDVGWFREVTDGVGRADIGAALAADGVGGTYRAAGHRPAGHLQALPCQCAFIDHTRAQTRRFRCSACNDRAAARLYRQRKRKI